MIDRIRNIDAILRERALVFARREEAEQSVATEALAMFSIGRHDVGVPLDRLVCAATLEHVTEIPSGPPYFFGVTSVEGHLVSLLNLSLFLGLENRGIDDITITLVVASGTREIGLGAARLFGIEDFPRHFITPLPGASGPLSRMARIGERELMILDVDALFCCAGLRKEEASHG